MRKRCPAPPPGWEAGLGRTGCNSSVGQGVETCDRHSSRRGAHLLRRWVPLHLCLVITHCGYLTVVMYLYAGKAIASFAVTGVAGLALLLMNSGGIDQSASLADPGSAPSASVPSSSSPAPSVTPAPQAPAEPITTARLGGPHTVQEAATHPAVHDAAVRDQPISTSAPSSSATPSSSAAPVSAPAAPVSATPTSPAAPVHVSPCTTTINLLLVTATVCPNN